MPEKYDEIGTGYNLSRKADPCLTQRLFELLTPIKPGNYLDLGCGTGNYTIALNQKGIQMVGIDPSSKMLSEAQYKSSKIKWLEGRAENIPLQDSSIDGAVCTLTIHHWKDLSQALKELHRILQKRGKVVIFTSTPEQMHGYWLNHYFPRMMKDSISQMPPYGVLADALNTNDFKIIRTEKYLIKPGLEDLFLYSGKWNPKLYLDSQVRQGISSFSALANKSEVDSGLAQLEYDISTGAMQEIIDSFENDKGDYLFVVAEKQ
ncbi:MAG: class I SAM-dependent methyltransferase [Cyclobacteriaceae bacterium]